MTGLDWFAVIRATLAVLACLAVVASHLRHRSR